MRLIKIITIIIFSIIIALPIAFFNRTPNAISVIDNKVLIDNPFIMEGDLTLNVENYVNDRIGFRDEMIATYTILNDKIFNKMVHPSYSYGKDGYVFGAGLTTFNDFNTYHIIFADMIEEIQKYCNDRNIPFLFVFNPAKPAIYSDKIATGLNYNRGWVELFLNELDKRGINYLDNTTTMLSLRKDGFDGFNQKYDANHWNDLGAFYGTQKILEQLHKLCDRVYVNQLEDFNRTNILQTSLQVSRFPIKEYVPKFSNNIIIKNKNDYISEMIINPSYSSFGYYINDSDNVSNTPKTLVFQGSYLNSYGNKFLQNAFSEYIYVHDYQNVINFPYYFNIFQPECVIFEVAEYTFSDVYFSQEEMASIDYNPNLFTIPKEEIVNVEFKKEDILIEKGENLTTIKWTTDLIYPHLWLSLDNIYDMIKTDYGYFVTIENENYEITSKEMIIYTADFN